MFPKKLMFPAVLAVLSSSVSAQILSEYNHLQIRPKGYVCYRTDEPIEIDGLLDEQAWSKAPFTDTFVDIEGDKRPLPYHDTQVKMLWDDDYLYIAAVLNEDHLMANLHQKDTIVYYDNDFEVFIDPDGDGHNYYEIETNAINTIFDLFLQKPYRDGGAVIFHWDCEDMKIKSHIQGTLNNPNDKDTLWTVEMAIPQKALRFEFNNPMKAGNYWRINFSRVQWDHEFKNGRYERIKDEKGNYKPEYNWVWSEQGLISMHMPERWGYLYFSPSIVGTSNESFVYPIYDNGKDLLWSMYYKQKDLKAKNGKFGINPKQLGLKGDIVEFRGESWKINIETTSRTFEMTATSPDGKQTWVINNQGHIRSL